MGLGVVSRYSTLIEAEVACAALRSAGLQAQVLDRAFGTMVWTDQVAIGGFRVVAPDQELPDAVALLTQAGQDRPRPRRATRREKAVSWRFLALLAGIFVMPEAGFLVLGARDRVGRRSAVGIFGLALVALTLGLLIYLVVLVLTLLGSFFDGWLIHPSI